MELVIDQNNMKSIWKKNNISLFYYFLKATPVGSELFGPINLALLQLREG